MSLYNKIIDLQKLREAWQRVRKNKPAAGVDDVSCELFDSRIETELKQLHIELADHRYHALPVKMVTIYRGDKAREIALYSMRDKVVQQSVATELNKIYDHTFPTRAFAYRNDYSALQAVNETNERIAQGDLKYILKVDIRHYFDEMRWELLQRFLSEDIREEDVMELIRENCCSVSLDMKSGDLVAKRKGIYQGSSISPILSNLYLRNFDRWMESRTQYYARFSDDMIALGSDREDLIDTLKEISVRLESLGLKLNQEKSMCVSLDEGLDFLGYHFDKSGKTIPAEAEERLAERLESMWLTSGDIGTENKLIKAQEITGGWNQYFREDREIGSVIELAALLYGAGDDIEKIRILAGERKKLENNYRDLMVYMSSVWNRYGMPILEMLEYEQYYQIPETGTRLDYNSALTKELIGFYRQFVVLEDDEIAGNIMQCYTDLQYYEAAAVWQKRQERIRDTAARRQISIMPQRSLEDDQIIFDNNTAARMMKAFSGREDIHSKEVIGRDRNRQSEMVPSPLTEKLLVQHLCGEITLGTYIQRSNATVRYIVIDVDVSKKVLLKTERGTDMFNTYLFKAQNKALDICRLLDHMGLRGYLEYSGYRGYHVWLFMTEWMPTRYANMLCECIEARISTDDDLMIEFFPNKTRVKEGKYGQVIKLPYGIHVKTGERSYFIDDEGRPVLEINPFIDGLARYTISAVKRVLASYTGIQESVEKKEVDKDLKVFGDIGDNVREVLDKCNLMRYLCQKSAKTSYLSHFERLTVLYVFGHMGDEGKDFIHRVMSLTLNYSYNTTEKYIQRRPDSPVSCVKLQDQYKMITAEIGCNCNFKKTKGCYPSPVLHAISHAQDDHTDITLPTPRTLTKENTSKVMDEINIHKKAQQLISRISEFRKQQRATDRNIRSLERELSALFDSAGVDALETDAGMLVRRRKENGYEWVIEI